MNNLTSSSSPDSNHRSTSLPAWMRDAGPASGPAWRSGVRSKNSAVQRTIEGLAAALITGVFSEKIASRPGRLQKMDPRAKTVSLLGLLLIAALVRQPLVLLALYAVTLAAARASLVSLRFFIKRVWLFIPIFAGLIVLPSIFNVVKAGDPLITIWNFGHEVRLGPWSLGSSIAITKQGLTGASILILRVAVSVSLTVLLAITTRWSDLLKALRVFFAPRIFILILSMTYRYIFLLLDIAAEMFTARRSRMAGPASAREDRRFAAASMGTLLGKSHALSEEVYAAMISRGYRGEALTLSKFHMRRPDWLLALAAAATGAAAIGADRLLG